MTFMTTFIHILEGVTALLVLLLLFQVSRYYRTSESLTQPEKAQPARSPQTAEKSVAGKTVVSSSDTILDDYIGGFFDANTSARVDIQALKVSAPPLSIEKESEESEEDSIITVMSTAEDEAGNGTEKVMTDKVVHAMLDEAKLICAS